MSKIKNLTSALASHGEIYPLEKDYTDRAIAWIEEHGEFAFVRENLGGHITGSFIGVDPTYTKVLLMLHHKLQMWLQFWGHADGDIDILAVALREFHEESWIQEEPRMYEEIFDVHVHPIPARWDEPEHLHYDLVFLGEIPEYVDIARDNQEVDDIQWFDIDWIEKYVAQPRMLSMIEKIRKIRDNWPESLGLSRKI